ncbi:MAG: ATP-binding protein, partial [Myxococcota bacterium]
SQKSPIIYRLCTRDGGTVYLQVKASAVFRDGRVWAIQGVGRDITRRLRAEAALRESELQYRDLNEKHRKIIESSPDAIVITDLDGNVVDYNSSFTMIYGEVERELVIGLNLLDMTSVESRPAAAQTLASALSGEQVKNVEVMVLDSARRPIPGDLSANLLRDVGGRPTGVIFIIRDISERKLMQEQLIQSEKMAAVGTLLAGLSHEINNPIGIILGYAQSMLKRVPEGSPFAPPLASIEREARRCGALVRTLLDFSRKPSAQCGRLDVSRFLERLEVITADRAAKAGVAFKVVDASGAGGEKPVVLEVYETEFESAIVNLVDNAIDATAPGGTVRVTAEPGTTDAGGMFIRVADNGHGIPPEIMQRIFEPFFTTKPVGKGTGLGLSLAMQTIERHMGKITVESGPGKGTVISVWVPDRKRSLSDGQRR